MKAGGGHAKGASFEREFSKQLSRWASHGDRDDVFWRTPGSGSRATRIPAVAHGGDICATHESGRLLCEHVLMELKSYKGIDWRHLLIDRRGKFHEFWIRLVDDAYNQGKAPLFVMKENLRSIVLATDELSANDMFRGTIPLVKSVNGMYLYTLDTLLSQPYETVCNRLRSSQ